MTAIAALVDEIGGHLRSLKGPGLPDVLIGFERWRRGAIDLPPPCANKVVDLWLGRAVDAVCNRPLGAAIAAAAPLLPWVTYDLYDRTLIGEAYADGHAFTPVIGGSGPVRADDFEIGVFLIAPGVFYRDHKHAAPELYAPLTGPHGWRFGPGTPIEWKAAPEPVWNEPFRPHATKVGAVPFLSLYVWTANVDQPAFVIVADDWDEIESGK